MSRLAALVLLALAASGCHEAASALGGTPAEARGRAEAVAGALAAYLGPIQREPGTRAARRLFSAPMAPSEAFEDATLWTTRTSTAHTREVWGRPTGGVLRVAQGANAPAPAGPGDWRARLRLERQAEGEYLWGLQEELALSPVPVGALSSALTALFTALEAAPAGDARDLLRRGMPRTAAALGRLVWLDELSLARASDGAVTVALRASADPARLEGSFPRYARFLKRHQGPVRFRVAVSDETGARWWEAEQWENRYGLRLRLKHGGLAPLDRAPMPMPDRLRARTDFTTKSGLFRVGFEGLVADVVVQPSLHERAFTAHFRRDPEWQLPFLVEPLLRGPLRRPFEGEGALMSWALREEAGGPTLLVREYRVAIKESWVVRLLGGSASGAISDFRREAEGEAHQFLGETMRALREDVAELLPSEMAR